MIRDHIIMDKTFPCSYRCEALYEFPNGDYPHYYYPGASTLGGRDGLLVRVFPDGADPWIGTFAGWPLGSRILSTPDIGRFCIVTGSAGYFVSAHDPEEWEAVCCGIVSDVRSVSSHDLIVFVDYTNLIAYGSSGIAWRTKRLAYDDVRITLITDTAIYGEGFYLSDTPGKFSVDILTGAHRGGATFPVR